MQSVQRSHEDDLLDGELTEKARVSVEQPQRKNPRNPGPTSKQSMQAAFDFDDQGSPNTIATRG